MPLKEEMKLKRDFGTTAEEAMLNVIYTAERWKKRSTTIYGHYGITPAQFNVLHLIYYQSDEDEGLTQAAISEMMLVKPANTTPLVDRLEKLKLVERTPVPEDRRFWRIKLLPNGVAVFKQANRIYYARLRDVYEKLSEEKLKALIASLEKVREYTTNFEPDYGEVEDAND
ncbi:MAG: MarR family transcriptional regulator [Candidatus Hydrogenedentota bacterium]